MIADCAAIFQIFSGEAADYFWLAFLALRGHSAERAFLMIDSFIFAFRLSEDEITAARHFIADARRREAFHFGGRVMLLRLCAIRRRYLRRCLRCCSSAAGFRGCGCRGRIEAHRVA